MPDNKQDQRTANRLIDEKSPYLLQHAHNPVDWYPWGDEAFTRAREEDKPIFLSIGYSTCHWCHVMERECFERDDIANAINSNFVAIKVDREEHPELDELYMSATQLLTGRGGWPNSVWLTPEGKAWFAGSYIPPDDSDGQPGFKTILNGLAEVWQTRRAEIEMQADQVTMAMRQMLAETGETSGQLTPSIADAAVEALAETFDEAHGGFGIAPKFPPHTSLRLLSYHAENKDTDRTLAIITRTLDAIMHGGIHDHLAGGFHRYATDARWFLPHFEKMLYDNAQLAHAYVTAWRLTGDEKYRIVAERTLDWLIRDMMSPDGGFFSALDADTGEEEGAYYVWTWDEMMSILGEADGKIFAKAYGVEKHGNYRDEATNQITGKNVLSEVRDINAIAAEEGTTLDALQKRLESSRHKLLDVRSERMTPYLDDKILADWNGLAIASLAYAGQHFNASHYIEAAEAAARFILGRMIRNGSLYHTWRDGDVGVAGFLDDYALVAQGFLGLYSATDSEEWLEQAENLGKQMIERFHDPASGGFFLTSEEQGGLIIRSKMIIDKAIPSGNASAAQVMLRLGELTNTSQYHEVAGQTLTAFAGVLQQVPMLTEGLILATAQYFDASDRMAPGGADVRPKAEHKQDVEKRTPPVTAELYTSALRLPPGTRVEVAIKLEIDEGWQINSHRPWSEALTPTRMHLNDTPIAAIHQAHWPDGRQMSFPFSDEPVSVYSGAVWFTAELAISRDAADGDYDLELVLHMQPCDSQSCAKPMTINLPFKLTVDSAMHEPEVRHESVFRKLHADILHTTGA